jgi:hypothetical protein
MKKQVSEKQKKDGRGTKQNNIGKGLDVGTAFIYSAQKNGNQVVLKSQRNAFLDVEFGDFSRDILKRSDVKYVRRGDRFYVVGDDAMKFANVFGKNTRRPLASGVISAKEEDALAVVELIIKNTLGPHRHKLETVYYSVPGNPVDADFNTIYHENIVAEMLRKWDYTPKPINEGLAVIYSELADENFTGIGISLGGGMANVCFANLSIPVFSFSIARAGDWVDSEVARVTNETVSRVTYLKETNLDLTRPDAEMDKIQHALKIYYRYLLEYILGHIKQELKTNARIPRLERPIPIVVSGGTAMPKGFINLFRELLSKAGLPTEVGEVRLASNPLHSVAKGALVASIADRRRSHEN